MLQNAVDFIRKKNVSRFFVSSAGDTFKPPKHKPSPPIEHVNDEYEFEDVDMEVADKKIAFRAMYFSLAILIATILLQYNSFHVSTLEAGFTSASKLFAQNSWFLVPVLCGVLSTVFTVFIVYKDSRVPGEDPPTPFSPTRKQRHSIVYSFHLNYIFALMVGLIVFAQMLYSRW